MYALGDGYYYRRVGTCHGCGLSGIPMLGYSEPYDAVHSEFCCRCTFSPRAEYPTTDVQELLKLWNRGERMSRAGIPAELERLNREAQAGVEDEERAWKDGRK